MYPNLFDLERACCLISLGSVAQNASPAVSNYEATVSDIIFTMRTFFKRQIALPQDHGSWVFLLSPLLIGIFAGARLRPELGFLVIAALAAFLIRQPISMAVKVYAGRRPKSDLPAAQFWAALYILLGLIGLIGLAINGLGFVFLLAIPAIPVFAWHLYLVSRRAERRQEGIEILAAGILALSAPAALWVEQGAYHPGGWLLWVLIWLQSAASIVYAYLRLAQRKMETTPVFSERLKSGRRALLYTTFNLLLVAVLCLTGTLPPFLWAGYLLQWLESLWGSLIRPAVGWKPTAIGIRQLIISTLFTILFILTWRLP